MYYGANAHTKTFTSVRKMMRTQRGVLYQIKVILIWAISRGTFTTTQYLFIPNVDLKEKLVWIPFHLMYSN